MTRISFRWPQWTVMTASYIQRLDIYRISCLFARTTQTPNACNKLASSKQCRPLWRQFSWIDTNTVQIVSECRRTKYLLLKRFSPRHLLEVQSSISSTLAEGFEVVKRFGTHQVIYLKHKAVRLKSCVWCSTGVAMAGLWFSVRPGKTSSYFGLLYQGGPLPYSSETEFQWTSWTAEWNETAEEGHGIMPSFWHYE